MKFFNFFFLLSVFLDMSQIQLLFPILGALQTQKIVIGLAMFGIISQPALIDNIRNAMNTPTIGVLIFLVAWILLSVPFGVYPGQSLVFITQSYWKVLITFLLVIAYVSTMDDVGNLVWVYISSVGMLAIITILSAGFGRMEINADVYDANDTALQFLLALPFAVWKFKSLTGYKRLIALLIALILLIGIVKTDSRGGFLGLVAVVLVIMLQLKTLEKRSLFGIFFMLAMVGCGFLYLADAAYIERISTMLTPSQDYNTASSTGRLQIWDRGIQMMFMNPILGVGVYNFMSAEGMIFAEIGARYQAAHNSFVQVGAELGIPGLVAFCLLIWRTLKNIRSLSAAEIISNKKITESKNLVATYSITGAITAFVVSGFFLSAAYITSLYFLLAMAVAIFSANHIHAKVIKQEKMFTEY
ncbi:MAG: O-antigen ligase family protein [Gammaproteobacteria bacterium]|nr:O-antigen ligase family protein [Gammaproteobacteria bacterium]